MNQTTGLILVGISLVMIYLTFGKRAYLHYISKVNYLKSLSSRAKLLMVLGILIFMNIYGLLMIFDVIDYTHPLYPKMNFK